jgi:DNA mismatch repair protein MLH3
VSLLSIASRHHQYRSHNALTFHHGNVIERQLATTSHYNILGQHGTCVTVRNLFGNLPVRVKQRSKVVEQKAENGRLWDHVKASVTGLLLSWPNSVSVRARDADNHVVFAFNKSDARSSRLSSMLNTLTQANYISVHQWPSWVPVSASTSSLSIKGAISLEPIPTRSVQFISLGARPLSSDSAYNEIYDAINRLFSLSSFGTIGDDSELGHEKLGRKADKAFEATGNPNLQTKARKGVDRYPMFRLHISFREGLTSKLVEDHFADKATSVESIMEVLGVMITQWLSIHRFRPVHLRQNRKGAGNLSVARVGSSGGERGAFLSRCPSRDSMPSSSSNTTEPDTTEKISQRVKRHRTGPTNRLQNQAFANWSRIKSGKAEFFDDQSAPKKHGSTGVTAVSLKSNKGSDVDLILKSVTSARLNTQPLSQGFLSVSAPKDDQVGDETLLWIDPVTKHTHTLNARTGCMVSLAHPKPATDPLATPLDISDALPNRSFRLMPKTKTVGKPAWLGDILKNWDNPVFKPSEQCIEQALPKELDSNDVRHRSTQHQCLHVGKDTSFDTLPVISSRLSKESLVDAEIIAQVDKKFILIKTLSSPGENDPQESPKPLLVLIDQHAADERVQVETLFRQLCSPVDSSCSSYHSKLGHRARVASTLLEKPMIFTISQHEQLLFTTHAERFASWGILFDAEIINMPGRSSASRETSCLLSVIALPPSISERCRTDTELLVSFLRSTVWKYANNSDLLSHSLFARDKTSPDWVGQLASCPEGLVDMINSRACRSAIMFNDELDLHQCRELVQNLAGCVFPFMCAHGRPSLVPLVEVGKAGHGNNSVELNPDTNTEEFVRDWKNWNR